jgi:thioredoxin 1
MATEITDQTFKTEVLDSTTPVCVDFWAPWCAPCVRMGPIIDELATQYTNVKFVKINIDDNQEIAQEYNIRSIPTFMVFKDHKLAGATSGGMPKDKFVDFLDSVL